MINLIKIGNTYNIPIRQYEVDTASEIEELPSDVPVGSMVTVLATGKTYKLNSSGEYVEFNTGEGGSGGGSELPEYSISNAGEALKVKSNGTGLEWGSVAADLPTPGTAGNVLTSTGNGWESAAPSGGAEKFIVDIVADESGEEVVYSAEHDGAPISISDIAAAHNTGKLVYATDGDAIAPCVSASETDVGFAVVLGLSFGTDAAFQGTSFYGEVDDGVDKWSVFNPALSMPMPDDNGGDRGKVVTVNSSDEYTLIDPKTPFTIHFTTDGTNYSTTETLGEILAALNNGRALLGIAHITIEASQNVWMTVRIEFIGEVENESGTYMMLVKYYNGDTYEEDDMILVATGNNNVFVSTT